MHLARRKPARADTHLALAAAALIEDVQSTEAATINQSLGRSQVALDKVPEHNGTPLKGGDAIEITLRLELLRRDEGGR